MSTVSFELAGMLFEYDEEKNRKNILKHGIDFRSAARVFSTMTALNLKTIPTATARNDITRLEIHPPLIFIATTL